MKRRVVSIGERRFRVELPGGDISEFSYRERTHRWDSAQAVPVDLDSDAERYILSWQGLFLETFQNEVDVLLFVIRFGYSLPSKYLVPSEILADFNLRYLPGTWVDDWTRPEQQEVDFAIGTIVRPENRKIRFEGYPRITAETEKVVVAKGWDNDLDRYHSPMREELKIPVLDFAVLEAPRKRRREVPRWWSDLANVEYAAWTYLASEKPDPRPLESGIFTLKSGVEAETAYQARKKVIPDLQE